MAGEARNNAQNDAGEESIEPWWFVWQRCKDPECSQTQEVTSNSPTGIGILCPWNPNLPSIASITAWLGTTCHGTNTTRIWISSWRTAHLQTPKLK